MIGRNKKLIMQAAKKIPKLASPLPNVRNRTVPAYPMNIRPAGSIINFIKHFFIGAMLTQ